MERMLIVADDLSGASDCAVASIALGLTATVALGHLPHDFPAQVVSIDGDTRHLDPAAAAAETVRLLDRYHPPAECLLFKKLDSTLRGNVAAELAAVLGFRRGVSRAPARVSAVMAPAFPAGGRTTVGGCQFVHGRPLDGSEIWTSEIRRHGRAVCPTHIPSLLALSGLRPVHLGLPVIRSGEDELRRAMRQGVLAADVLVCDAETDEDLLAIARASLVLGPETVWAGSAGLARHLPGAAGMCAEAVAGGPDPVARGPSLVVIGSMSEVSRGQVEELGRGSEARIVTVPAGVLLLGAGSPEWSGCAAQIRATLLAGSDVAVIVGADGRFDAGSGRRVSAALATMMEPVADVIGGLIASGGETARAVLELWGVTGLRMVGEVEPGVPFAVTEGWRRQLPVITKAGAFGGPRTMIECVQFLQGLDRGRESGPAGEES